MISLMVLAALAQAQDTSGFIPIFDGKTLAGWEGDTLFWRAEGGMLIGETTAERRLTQNTFLIWRGGSTRDFELKLEYRISANGNSGVQYRSSLVPEAGRHVMKGYQADLDGPNRWSGQIYEERGRGFLALRGAFVRVTGPGAAGKQPLGTFGPDSTLKALLLPDDWNALHIIARGSQIIQIVNGRVMSGLVDEDQKGRALDGLLGLQVHMGPPMRVEFRNIRIKRET